jgi:xanthine dehydrogenase accessory factor
MSQIKLYQILRDSIQRETPVALATVISSQPEELIRPGSKMAVFTKDRVEGSLGDSDLDANVISDALNLLAREKSKTLTFEFADSAQVEVYIESIHPPPTLIVIGGDPDSQPIVTLAKQLGFKVVLVDHRAGFANPERYPEADATIESQPEEIAQKVKFEERSFVLVKTHNYLQDKEILKAVLKSKTRYVGQLGPKARVEDLIKDLADEGITFTEEELGRLYAPVGLDIGAESPEQIATSILAEMLAVRTGRVGGFLRQQTAAIHPRE